MLRVFYHTDGTPSPIPTSKKEARKFRHNRYDPGEDCTICHTRSARYVYNDECQHCSLLTAIEFYNLVIGVAYADVENKECLKLFSNDKPPSLSRSEAHRRNHKYFITEQPCDKAGHVGVRRVDNKCHLCETTPKLLSPRQQAIHDGHSWYIPATACPRCNTVSERHVDNGSCRGCKPVSVKEMSPRQQAIHDGLSWYIPTTECPRCNTISERHVANGSCKGCVVGHQRPDNGVGKMMELWPDMIISKADARVAELTVYRTGKECCRGHNVYRYVSTGTCISCLRGKS